MIKCNFKYKSFNFPCGEKHICIEDIKGINFPQIEFEYQNDAEIIQLLLINDAVIRIWSQIDHLLIPYIPFSRQDRINKEGECFSLKVFCDLINSMKVKSVTIIDPHSDVTPALINNCTVIHQQEIFQSRFKDRTGFYLVSPDGGALKKIYKLASLVNPLGVVECSKKRNTSTGEITGVNVPCGWKVANDFIIVDDICDGGRTFIEISKEIKNQNPSSKVILMVTHGFFTKGLEVFEGLIDEVYTRKGRIK